MASRQLKVEIIGDASSLNKAFGSATKTSGGLGSALTKLGKVAAVGVGAAFVGLGIVVKKGFDELAEGQKVTAQTAARLKSTGDAAHVTAQQVSELATAQSKLTGIDDEAVQAGENMLLTFTNIRNEVGKTNDIFDQSTVAVEDMATAMNDGAIPSAEQLSTTAIRVGKALNDPVKGMTALSRVGVQFTADQKKTIEALVKSGDTMGAQKVILAELTKEFGGSAKAAGDTFPGQLAKLRNAFDDASSKVAVVFLPALTKAMGFITDKLIPAISNAADFIGNFWKGISEKLSRAPTLKAKLRVVFTGVENLAKQLVDALFSQVERLLPQKPLVIQPQTKVAVGGGEVDWNKTANMMLTALGVALQQSTVLAAGLAHAVSNSIDQVPWVEVGKKLGPAFAAMLASAVATLSDPVFWVKNWDLVLAIAFAKFGGSFARLGKPLIAPFAKLGGDMMIALAEGIARMSPRAAEAFLAALVKLPPLLLRLLELLKVPFTALENLVRKQFGRLGGLAVFTIRVLGITAALGAIADFVRGGIAKFKEFLDWVSKLPGKIKGYFSGAGTWLYSAGVAIIQGLWDGLKSKWDAVASWLGGLGGKIRDLKGPPAKDAALLNDIGQLIMKGLGDGMNVGWNKIALMLDGLSPKLKTKVGAMVDAIQQAITDKQGAFATAFDSLASAALSAFDKVTQDFQTKTEKKIARQDEARAARDRAQALKDANATLAQAQAAQTSLTPQEGESPEDFAKRQADAAQAVTDAINQQNEARFQIQRAADEKRAEQERKAYENSRELQRRHFDEQLATLENKMEAGTITVREFRKRVLALFEKFDVPFRNAGHALGSALAEGLHESFSDAATAARRLIEAISEGLAKAKFIVSIEVQQSTPKHRQFGGSVKRGSPYVVGEAGPELFIPSSAGRISPALAGGGGVGGMAEIHTNVYIDSVQVTELVRREMLRFEKRNGRSAV